MDGARNYLNLIFLEKEWSWTLVGIAYLIGGLFIRSLFFRPLVRETKETDSNLYPAVRTAYLKKSGAGWVFFSLSFLAVIAVWVGWKSIINDFSLIVFVSLLITLLFSLSVILHLSAYAKALLFVLRQKMGVEKEF